jgi:hypothetical protein
VHGAQHQSRGARLRRVQRALRRDRHPRLQRYQQRLVVLRLSGAKRRGGRRGERTAPSPILPFSIRRASRSRASAASGRSSSAKSSPA